MSKKVPPLAKITWAEVHKIRASTETQTELSKRFGISRAQVQRILANVHWHDPEHTPQVRKRGPKKKNNRETKQRQLSLKIEVAPIKRGLWATLKAWAAKVFTKLTN